MSFFILKCSPSKEKLLLFIDIIKKPLECTCVVRQYPWLYTNGFIIKNRCMDPSPLASQFHEILYNDCFKHLSKGKIHGARNIQMIALKTVLTFLEFGTLNFS